MKVRMTKTAAGPDGVWIAGKVYAEIPEQEAWRLVAAGAAVLLEKPMEPAEPETASIEPEEAAVPPKPHPKKGKGKKK